MKSITIINIFYKSRKNKRTKYINNNRRQRIYKKYKRADVNIQRLFLIKNIIKDKIYNLSKIAMVRAIIPGTPTDRIHKTKFIFISKVFNLFSSAWNFFSISWNRFSISCQNSRKEIFKSFFDTKSSKSCVLASKRLRSSLCSMFASRTVHLLNMLHQIGQKVQQKVQFIFDLKMTYNRCKYTLGVFVCL